MKNRSVRFRFLFTPLECDNICYSTKIEVFVKCFFVEFVKCFSFMNTCVTIIVLFASFI